MLASGVVLLPIDVRGGSLGGGPLDLLPFGSVDTGA